MQMTKQTNKKSKPITNQPNTRNTHKLPTWICMLLNNREVLSVMRVLNDYLEANTLILTSIWEKKKKLENNGDLLS